MVIKQERGAYPFGAMQLQVMLAGLSDLHLAHDDGGGATATRGNASPQPDRIV